MKKSESVIAVGRRANEALTATYCQEYLSALRTADLPRANRAVSDALDDGMDSAVVHSKIIAPAMRAIGELWEKGQINVGEEHIATAITEQVLVRVLDRTQTTASHSRGRVMLAALQGQHHVLGLRMVADLLEGAGYDVLFLGADVPIDSLREVAAAKDPELVGLSFGIAISPNCLAESICAVREGAPGCRLMLGGGAPPPDPGIFEFPWISDSLEVVSTVERLFSEPPQVLSPVLQSMLGKSRPPNAPPANRGHDSD